MSDESQQHQSNEPERLSDFQRVGGVPPDDAQRVRVVNAVDVQFKQPSAPLSDHRALWTSIRNRTGAMSFSRYEAFIAQTLCGDSRTGHDRESCSKAAALDQIYTQRSMLPKPLHGVDAYLLLKAATELFLLRECGVRISPAADGTIPGYENRPLGESLDDIRGVLKQFLKGKSHLPFFDGIYGALNEGLQDDPFCFGLLKTRFECPCLIELIWSYWHEEGMLVQTVNAIALRFQNRRSAGDKDPLASMEIGFLRPLNNLLWGYIQDEVNRLTIVRRAYKYDHHYGLTLVGKAVPQLRSADSRSKFLAAFHNLLHRTTEFYKQLANLMVVADAFPLLQALKETHLLLAEGMHNQYGDLPWTARVEMLMQQWILSRPEVRRFLQSREMVPYPEGWMGQVDAMKTLQGWTDSNVRHFRDLAVFGEQILLSIRFSAWSSITDAAEARQWAEQWRPEVQGYIDSYRAVTGVDLSNPQTVDATLPWVHLKNRARSVSNG